MPIFHKLSDEEKQIKVDEKFMRVALKEAKKAYSKLEVPIGCVITYDNKIIGKAYNKRNTLKDATSHAEILAIKKANKKINDWRLEDCTIYITLEPCQMCAGAIVQSRIKRVVIGAMNPKAGCCGSILNILNLKEFNHQCLVSTKVLENECKTLLSSFFRDLRDIKSNVNI